MKEKNYKLRRFYLLLPTLLLLINLAIPIKASSLSGKRILVLCSYSIANAWEQDIIKGISDSAKEQDIIKFEFLDSKSPSAQGYSENFTTMLNLKYQNEDFDYIITIDDEAFNLVRENLFKEDSFAYKKHTLFVGVNNTPGLTSEENYYLSGMIDTQYNNIEMLDLIYKNNKNLKDIYFLIDTSIYANAFKSFIDGVQYNNITLHTVQSPYFDDIAEVCKDLSRKTTAICISGDFLDKEALIPTMYTHEEIIKKLQEVTNAPIYSVIKSYIDAGAIGGLINDGHKLGQLAISLIDFGFNKTIQKNPFVPPSNIFYTYYFNYKSIRKYNINPLKLPSNATYINKKSYNLLLPLYLIVIVYLIALLFIVGATLVIYIIVRNKREAAKNSILLSESIEREKIKTESIITLSHELRTPINIIKNTVNLLNSRLGTDEVDKEFFSKRLGYISNNTNRLTKYTNNLIDVTRLEMGSIVLHIDNINIVSVVEDITMFSAKIASKYNIDVVFDTNDEEIIIATDKRKVERIFLNLLSNAIKFTNPGGNIKVFVRKTDTETVSIEVSDTGIGMSKESLDLIFEKFKRVNMNSEISWQYEGSGLGLYIVKKFLELLDGTIYINSALGKGTNIFVTLPIYILGEDEIKEDNSNIAPEYDYEIEFSDIDKK